MPGGSAIRGQRLGGALSLETERGHYVEKIVVTYWCAHGHSHEVSYVDDPGTEVPAVRDCPQCGQPAGLDKDNPPQPVLNEPYKTHLAYVQERRSEKEGEDLLEEALTNLRERGFGRGILR